VSIETVWLVPSKSCCSRHVRVNLLVASRGGYGGGSSCEFVVSVLVVVVVVSGVEVVVAGAVVDGLASSDELLQPAANNAKATAPQSKPVNRGFEWIFLVDICFLMYNDAKALKMLYEGYTTWVLTVSLYLVVFYNILFFLGFSHPNFGKRQSQSEGQRSNNYLLFSDY